MNERKGGTGATIILGDARDLPLADNSVDLIVTSPPYWSLRSYTDGGEHYAGQIGAESTPAAYIDSLVECTREWVRVLKPSGSLWVNLGDSYSGKPSSDGSRRRGDKAGARGERPDRRVAGRQFTREEAAWLAGVIDSDGSISVHVNKQPEGRAPSFVAWMRIGQMMPEVVHRAAEVTGVGQVMQDARGVWSWSASAQQARWVLSRIHPWLLIKRRQALAAIEVARHVEDRNGRGGYRPLTADDVAYRQRLRDAVLAWNAGQPDDLVPPDAAAVALPIYPNPAGDKSLRGLPWWYAQECVGRLGLILRAEVIWSKSNAMPESVTDRVRRSHETWFHFTRSSRYFSAIDNLREAYRGDRALSRRVKRPGAGKHDQRAVWMQENPLGALPNSVWEIATQPLKVPGELGIDHYAAFPAEWPRRIIQGWSPSGICTACGEGRRPVAVKSAQDRVRGDAGDGGRGARGLPGYSDITRSAWAEGAYSIAGEACACPDVSSPTRPSVVLDPFGGTGTTALVAHVLGRRGISVDMSADYCRLAAWRTQDPAQMARVTRARPGKPRPPRRGRPPQDPTLF